MTLMSKEYYEASVEETKRTIKNIKHALSNDKPICIICGEPMINVVDSVTKKVSKYLWKTNCEHAKNLRLSIG